MKFLIADSGSTKTDWTLLSDDGCKRLATQGLNPFHQTDAQIADILSRELLPCLSTDEVGRVYFYGSGIRPEKEQPMADLLGSLFTSASVVEAHSDLLGAARAVCGRQEGIACILGTGANSCLYDGSRIVRNLPALGYILGDEGSGAVLGKRFLHDLYGGLLSKEMISDFESAMGLSLPQLIRRVYQEPLPNRFLASLSPYIHSRLDHIEIRQLVINNFADFLRLHVGSYHRPDLPVSFVGSMAWHYQDQLREAAESTGFCVGTLLRSPMDGLVDYYR